MAQVKKDHRPLKPEPLTLNLAVVTWCGNWLCRPITLPCHRVVRKPRMRWEMGKVMACLLIPEQDSHTRVSAVYSARSSNLALSASSLGQHDIQERKGTEQQSIFQAGPGTAEQQAFLCIQGLSRPNRVSLTLRICYLIDVFAVGQKCAFPGAQLSTLVAFTSFLKK